MKERIEARLSEALTPTLLTVMDESEAHRGHAGFQEGGESHFRVVISSQSLSGKPRVAQHRAIYGALGPEIMAKIHALAIDVR
ncbi:MAG: BolA family protein [Pseudomonadota bacterium]